jgi:hypothetical protein
MEKTKRGARKQVMIRTIPGINGDLVSRPTSPTRNDEELIFRLKSFIGVAVTAEE